MDKLVPDMYQQSIYTINYQKLKKDGIKCLLFDLDNTCVAYNVSEPSEKLKELFDKLKDDFKVIIFSNALKKRIKPFKDYLVVDCQSIACKPFKKNFLKVIKKFKYDISEVAIIGDQLFTDILGGNKVGIKTILVNPISKEDLIFTKYMRHLENKQFNKMHKRGIYTKGKYYE